LIFKDCEIKTRFRVLCSSSPMAPVIWCLFLSLSFQRPMGVRSVRLPQRLLWRLTCLPHIPRISSAWICQAKHFWRLTVWCDRVMVSPGAVTQLFGFAWQWRQPPCFLLASFSLSFSFADAIEGKPSQSARRTPSDGYGHQYQPLLLPITWTEASYTYILIGRFAYSGRCLLMAWQLYGWEPRAIKSLCRGCCIYKITKLRREGKGRSEYDYSIHTSDTH